MLILHGLVDVAFWNLVIKEVHLVLLLQIVNVGGRIVVDRHLTRRHDNTGGLDVIELLCGVVFVGAFLILVVVVVVVVFCVFGIEAYSLSIGAFHGLIAAAHVFLFLETKVACALRTLVHAGVEITYGYKLEVSGARLNVLLVPACDSTTVYLGHRN